MSKEPLKPIKHPSDWWFLDEKVQKSVADRVLGEIQDHDQHFITLTPYKIKGESIIGVAVICETCLVVLHVFATSRDALIQLGKQAAEYKGFDIVLPSYQEEARSPYR